MNYDISCYIACPTDSTEAQCGRLLMYIQAFLLNLENDGFEYAIDVRNVYDARTEIRKIHLNDQPIVDDNRGLLNACSSCRSAV